MASSSALSFSTFPSTSRFNDVVPSSSSPSSLLHRFSDRHLPPSPSRSASFTARSSNSGNFSGDDPFGFYPWESAAGDNGIEWEQQETITLFTADGLVQIGGLMVPKRVSPSRKKQSKVKTSPRSHQFKESNYMDPAQGLCLGALFDIAATNGLDTGRRLCIIGFCRSIEMLSDVVEDTVLEHGGEVVAAEKGSKGGLNEKLKMTVAVPLLWGVPPASESLQIAVRSGGGIVDKVFWQWNFCVSMYRGKNKDVGFLLLTKDVEEHIVPHLDENLKRKLLVDGRPLDVVLINKEDDKETHKVKLVFRSERFRMEGAVWGEVDINYSFEFQVKEVVDRRVHLFYTMKED